MRTPIVIKYKNGQTNISYVDIPDDDLSMATNIAESISEIFTNQNYFPADFSISNCILVNEE